MNKQVTNHLMMIRPVAFHMNQQTAINNFYQQKDVSKSNESAQSEALSQFDSFVKVLKREGVNVLVFEDTLEPSTPDSVFPNNWISFHEEGIIRLYPMYAENRRGERRSDIIDALNNKFKVKGVQDLSEWESKGAYLEGTGSLLLDRQNKIAYAAISERTSLTLLDEFCQLSGFNKVTFQANQTISGKRLPIYHTNVMMCLGEKFAVVCLDSIDDERERKVLVDSLTQTEKEIIPISEFQKENFAGNMLQVIGSNDQRLVVMSTSAYRSLENDQIEQLELHGKIVHSDIPTIEKLGGGSARCMMAEIFLRPKEKLYA